MFIRQQGSRAQADAMSIRIILTLAGGLASAAHAETGTTVALSPAQVEAAKEAGAARNANAAALGIEPAQDRQIHGEVGFSVGTGGYSALYGTAVAPLGDTGYVAISVERENYGRARRYRGR